MLIQKKLGLAECTKLTKTLPSTLFYNISLETATQTISHLRSLGNVVTLEESNDEDKTQDEINLSAYFIKQNSQIKCPRCGSTAITTGQRGFSIVTGFLGSNKTVNRCGKCGYSWKP